MDFDWKFYLDNYSDLRKRGISTEIDALNHWYSYGKYENRIPNKKNINQSSIPTNTMSANVIDFDWKFYLDYYPDLRQNGILSEIDAINHWNVFGKNENRIPNKEYINKPMRTILFTNARDEENILEWYAHHINLGFTHIYIFDHQSIKPISTIINDKNVTVKQITGNSIKIPLMNIAKNIAIEGNYDWMLYLDADEFLILNFHENVNDFIKNYELYDQIGINWLLFGSNYHDKTPSGTMLEKYTRSCDKLNKHIKSFIRPTKIIYIDNPHFYFIQNMNNAISTNFNKYDIAHPYWLSNNEKYTEVVAYIAHYYVQSYETYLSRKAHIPRDDTGLYRDPQNKEEIYFANNDIINMNPCNKYNEKNKKFMYEYIKL